MQLPPAASICLVVFVPYEFAALVLSRGDLAIRGGGVLARVLVLFFWHAFRDRRLSRSLRVWCFEPLP